MVEIFMASVLIIEDDAQLRRLLREGLEQVGYEVREAADGALGVKSYRRRAAHLVLCDLIMPEREGLETIEELRTLAPEVPIVAMSGGTFNGKADFLRVAAKLGATATLPKPFSIQELVEM